MNAEWLVVLSIIILTEACALLGQTLVMRRKSQRMLQYLVILLNKNISAKPPKANRMTKEGSQ